MCNKEVVKSLKNVKIYMGIKHNKLYLHNICSRLGPLSPCFLHLLFTRDWRQEQRNTKKKQMGKYRGKTCLKCRKSQCRYILEKIKRMAMKGSHL